MSRGDRQPAGVLRQGGSIVDDWLQEGSQHRADRRVDLLADAYHACVQAGRIVRAGSKGTATYGMCKNRARVRIWAEFS